MVAAIVTGLVLGLCMIDSVDAQSIGSAWDRSVIDSLGSDLLDRLNESSDPDAASAQLQLLLDDIESSRFGALRSRSSFELRTRLQVDPDLAQTSDYQRHHYRGSPMKTSTALTARSDELELSIVQAKDPGEPLYLDHLVASVSTRKPIAIGAANIHRFVLGSYALSYGNGLAFSRGYPQFPTALTVTTPMSNAEPIAPYRSTSSYRYFNGAAVSMGIGNITADVFYSERLIDATLDSNAIVYVSQSGLHRTTTELDRRADATQTMVGAGLRYSLSDSASSPFTFGLLTYTMKDDHAVTLSDSSSFAFGGNRLSMLSAIAAVHVKAMRLDGEYATSFASGNSVGAASLTATVQPWNALTFCANAHILPATFYSPFGGTFGLRSDNAQNERGYYLGASWDVTRALRAFGYSMIADNSVLPSSSSPTSRTLESRMGAAYRWSSSTVEAQARFVNRSQASGSITEYLVKIEHAFSPTFSLRLLGRSRMIRDSSALSAYAISFGARYRPVVGVSVSMLIEPFRSDSYTSRIFSVEPDLAGTAPFVQLYGRGVRYKLVASYDASWLRAEAVAGQTVFAYPADAPIAHNSNVGMQLSFAL